MLYTYETPSHASILLALRELHPQRHVASGSVEIIDIISELKKQRLNLVKDIVSTDVHKIIDIHDFVENSQDFFGIDDEILMNTLKKVSGITSFFWFIIKDNKYFGCLAVKIPQGKKFNPNDFKMYFELEYTIFQSTYNTIIKEARQKTGTEQEANPEENRETIDVDHMFDDSGNSGGGMDQGQGQ